MPTASSKRVLAPSLVSLGVLAACGGSSDLRGDENRAQSGVPYESRPASPDLAKPAPAPAPLLDAGAAPFDAAGGDADPLPTSGWLRTWGDWSSDEVDDVVASGNGVVVAGSGRANEAIGPIVHYVARFDGLGALAWAQPLPGGGYSFRHPHVTAAPDGSVVATGLFSGTNVDFDPGPPVDLFSADRPTSFVTKFDAAGHYLWTHVFDTLPSSGDDDPRATVLADGSIIVAGNYERPIDVEPPPSYSGRSDAFAAKLTAAGQPAWVRTWGANREDWVSGVVARPGGGVIVCGGYVEYADYAYQGDLPVGRGSSDGFVLALDKKGRRDWSRVWGGSYDDFIAGCAVSEDGTIAVTGWIASSGTFHLADGTTTNLPPAGRQPFLYVFASTGEPRAFRTWGGGGDDRARVVTAMAGGDFLVAGAFDIGGLTGAGTSGPRAAIARFDAEGNHRASFAWGPPDAAFVMGAAVLDADVVLGGGFAKSVDFAEFGTRTAQAFTDAFLWRRPLP